jgi:fused signal recognition particle receptor
MSVPAPATPAPERKGWLDRLKAGLRKTGTSITTVFTGTQINDALYEELEEALLMADTGVKATTHLLADLKQRVKEAKATDPAAVKALLADALADLLRPLEKPLIIGQYQPTVIMVAGVNGAGKTTSIGKLTKHLADEGAAVLLAAADTFRAAAREQLGVWADRNTVEIVSQEGGDPAAVSYDAVTAGKARHKDVVLVDTAGRLPTQLHLMEELKKIRRVGAAGDRRQHRPERAGPGALVRRCLATDRPHRDQTGRHGQGRRAGRHRAGTPHSGVLHRRGRKAGRPGNLQRPRVCPGAADLNRGRHGPWAQSKIIAASA